MKGFTKICLLICFVCVCIGAVCLGVGVALGSGLKEVWAMAGNGDFDVGNLHIGGWNIPYIITDGFGDYDEDYENVKIQNGIVKEQFPAKEAENLEIDVKYGEVKLIDSESDQIEITVDAPESHRYKCGFDGATVTLLDQTSGNVWRKRIGKSNNVTVTIAIPKGSIFDEVNLTTNAGTIDISHNIQASEFHLELDAGALSAEKIVAEEAFTAEVGAGELDVSEFTAESLDVNCGLGVANLSGIVLEDADVDCGMGQIMLKLYGRQEDYNYDISCGLGTVEVNGEVYSALSVDKEIDHDADRTITLKCGMGEISVFVEEDEYE